MYINVTLRRVRTPIFAVERSKYCILWLCFCSFFFIHHAMRRRRIILSFAARPAIQYFFQLLQNRQDFRKKLLNIKFVLISVKLSSRTYLILSRTERDVLKSVPPVFMSSTRYSCHILMILEFSRQIFEKHSNTKFNEDASSGSRVVPCGRRDGRTDTTKLTVAFRNFARASKN
jgi:hypothetical protein